MGTSEYPTGQLVSLRGSEYDGRSHRVIVFGSDKRGSQILTGCYLYRCTTKVDKGSRPDAAACLDCKRRLQYFLPPPECSPLVLNGTNG